TFLFHSLLDIGFYHESLYVDFCLLAALITGDRPSWETPESKKRYIAGPTKSYMVFILPVACSLLLFPSLVLRPLLSASWKQYGDAAAQDDQDWTSALEYYQKALGHEPDDPWIHQRIGRAWFHLGDPRKAQIHLVKAVEINPLSASLKDELAALYKATFRIDEAVLWQTKAVQAYPFKAEYHYRLARYLMEKGQKDAAIKAAREAERVELDPAAKEAFRQYALSIAQ
ncbi:MAG TPA: tetratricopeptide repeat protein, partial [Candidatus Sumerlaeota bacterium]|nr:tetratricopeptide repeat protein [Candidatus Sumerlaeota bacterium]